MTNPAILVVEDSPTEMRMIVELLEQRNYRVITATDGEDGLHKALREKPDLIILDVILPKKNGFQVCRQLKKTPETSGIKILMLTHKDQESDRFWGKKQGADEYMTKPFDAEAFLNGVAALL